nr:biopolymer transporter ExbD [Flavobacterium hibisci]
MEINRKVRSRKLTTSVDLTAMVSISFLLIIFFMVAGELRKPKMMDLGVPDCIDEWSGGCYRVDELRVLTLLLDDNNKMISYMGLIHSPVQNPKQIDYGKNGIRKELIAINKKIHQYTDSTEKGVIVIIKPSKKSNYGNLVDILDEMNITGINSYAIVNDFTPEETKLLASN